MPGYCYAVSGMPALPTHGFRTFYEDAPSSKLGIIYNHLGSVFNGVDRRTPCSEPGHPLTAPGTISSPDLLPCDRRDPATPARRKNFIQRS